MKKTIKQIREIAASLDNDTIIMGLRNEHPQVIATTLLVLDDYTLLEEVIDSFPKRLQTDISLRMTSMEPVIHEGLANKILAFMKILERGHFLYEPIDIDQRRLYYIIAQRQDILAGIEEIDPDLRAEIEDRPHTYDDIRTSLRWKERDLFHKSQEYDRLKARFDTMESELNELREEKQTREERNRKAREKREAKKATLQSNEDDV